LGFEALEDRRVLSTVTISSLSDVTDGNTSNIAALIANPGADNKISMREAIQAANFTEGEDTINFSTVSAHGLNGGTVLLTQGQLSISQSVTIDASMLSNGITIDAGDTTTDVGDGIRIFHITDPTAGSALVTLKGLTLKRGDPVRNSGNQEGNGGAIYSEARLSILDCTIEENDAYTGGGIHINVAGDSSNTDRQVLTIDDSTIRNNEALAGGGIDIDADDTSDRFSITRTTISNNHALSESPDSGAGGGGVFADLYGARLTFTDSTISGNTTAAQSSGSYDEGGGGGLSVKLRESASLAVDNTLVTDNHASSGSGGGILAKAYYAPNPYQAITITRSTISDNTAGDRGGGLFLFNQEGTEVLVQESRVTGNEVPSGAANGNGGGIYAYLRNFIGTSPKPKWTITGSTVDDNDAHQKGGGIFVRSSFNGDFIATNSTISGNKTTDVENGAGGGIYIWHNDHSVDVWLRNLTVTQNVSALGGAVAVVDEDNTRVRIANSIISENFNLPVENTNRAPNNLDGRVYIPASTPIDLDEFTHNLIGSGSTVRNLNGSVVASSAWDDANIFDDEPLLDDLADNGGPTPTHRLRYEPIENIISPAIDAGSEARATVPLTGDPANQNDDDDLVDDQRGTDFPRIVDLSIEDGTAGSVDIGAYEVDSAFICVSNTEDELDSDLSDGDLSLREAVKYAIHTAPDSTTICLPAGDYDLERNGAGDEHGDLDIVGGVHSKVAIVGDGPGLSVINAGTLPTKERVFDVFSGKVLDLSGVTLKLGDTPSGSQANGGAIRVQNGGELNLRYSAIVGNDTGQSGTGGAIYFAPYTLGSIESSVITVNTADEQTGGIYLEAGYGKVTIKSTIVANNNVGETDPDIYAGAGRTLQSLGYNRFTSYAGFTLHDTDYVGSVNYVVTSVADTYDGDSDAMSMSLRDAIHRANITSGAEEIWLPAWEFRLTREGTESAQDVSINDIDVTENLTIRGIDRLTTVDATAIDDAAFGQFNGAELNLVKVIVIN
jgi:CSLREA domain-containing protein